MVVVIVSDGEVSVSCNVIVNVVVLIIGEN